jgi:hypothetical protein
MHARRRPGVHPDPYMFVLAEGYWGATLLLAPRPLLQAVAREPVDRRVTGVARVLGARSVLQAFATAQRPTRRRLEVGALVDATHAASMIAAAAADIGPRALTIASAATASAFAFAGFAQSRWR